MRESDSEEGTFHESDLPPTKWSLASEKLKKRKKRTSDEEHAALEKLAILRLLLKILKLKKLVLVEKGCRDDSGGYVQYAAVYIEQSEKLAVRVSF